MLSFPVCPAQELCDHLTGGGNLQQCHYQALHDEPYYGRGNPEDPATKRSHRRSVGSLSSSLEPISQPTTSVDGSTTHVTNGSGSGSGSDSGSDSGVVSGNRSLSSSRPEVCNETETAIRREACHETFGRLCFEGNDDLIRDITGVLCDEIWSCEGIALHWHQWKRGRSVSAGGGFGVGSGSSTSTVLMVGKGRHHWREKWRPYCNQLEYDLSPTSSFYVQILWNRTTNVTTKRITYI